MKQPLSNLYYYFNLKQTRAFSPYFEKENDFNRLVRIHSIAAFVFCPLFTLFIHFTEVPPFYQYLSLSYTFFFPIYVVMCKSIPFFRQKLVYFFFVHLFILSVFSFYHFYQLDYAVEHLFYFSFIYSLTLYVTQRMIPAILYNLLIGGMMLIGFTIKAPQTFSSYTLFLFYLLFTSASVLVLFSRERMIKSVEDYSDYLKQILNNPGTGFILFNTDRNKPVLIDFNEQACCLLDKKAEEIEEVFNLLSVSDFNSFYHLTFDERFSKTIELNTDDSSVRHLELVVTIMQLKNGFYYLLRILDITSKVHEKELELRARIAEENNEVLGLEIKDKIEALRLLKEQFIRMNSIFDKSLNTMLAIISTDNKIIISNTYFKEYFKNCANITISEGIKLDLFIRNVFDKKYFRTFNQALSEIQRGNSTQFEVSLVNGEDTYFIEIYLNPIVNIEGTLLEISMVAHDITQKKKQAEKIIYSLKEKELLLKEIHHRVKNNLQIISSIINLQSASIQDENTINILRESKNRIYTMATIHENLYQSEQFSSIFFASYLKKLVGNALASYQSSSLDLHVNYDLEEIELSLDQAIPCGLIVNELLTNVMKYAFKERKKGELTIELSETNGKIKLIFADNGVGLPKDLVIEQTTTLGLQLVSTLINQLDGEFKVYNDFGTKFIIIFDKIKL